MQLELYTRIFFCEFSSLTLCRLVSPCTRRQTPRARARVGYMRLTSDPSTTHSACSVSDECGSAAVHQSEMAALDTEAPLLSQYVKHQRGGRATLRTTVFNLVNSIFGTGFLLYPKQLVAVGIVNGLIQSAVLIALIAFSLHALRVAIDRSPPALKAYPETIAHFTSSWCGRVVR